jgi:hypothetical protein
MRVAAAPFKPPKQKGAHPPSVWQPPDVTIEWGTAPKKSSLLLTTFHKRKTEKRLKGKYGNAKFYELKATEKITH